MTDSYSHLLSWHAAHIRSLGHIEFGATILRTRSKALHDVLAYIATDDKYTVAQLKEKIYEGMFHQLDFRNLWLATLGRVVTIQALEEEEPGLRAEELDFGMTCLEHANNRIPRIQQHQQFQRLEIELLAANSLSDEARALLDANEFLSDFFHGYLRSDLDNPVISGSRDTYESWLRGFNRPFIEKGLLPILPVPSGAPRFNEIATEPAATQSGAPKVSVLMTSFKPDRADFLTAVKSILNQSWENLELIIVDDASPSEYNIVLEEAAGLDHRIRLIKLEVNGGTYRARNVGVKAATGEFVTGQDSDDWSHPERIAYQVQYLLENPAAPGVIVEAIRVNNELIRAFPGRIPHGPCEVSFMLRAELARQVGGYLEVRKGADGEFRRRIEKYTGEKVEIIEKPLYLIRIGHDSLSRADFKPGWTHPVRHTFWNNSGHWHENTAAEQLTLEHANPPPIPIPNRFKIIPPHSAAEYDAVYVGDLRAYDSTQRAIIDEIIALRSRDKRVGVLHLESIMSPSNEPSRFCFEIQALVNAGEINVVIPDEDAVTKLAVLHDPTILQFASASDVNLIADLVVINPDLPPTTGMSGEVIYRPDDCAQAAQRMFDGDVVWTSNDPQILQLLSDCASGLAVDTRASPVAFRPRRWTHSRKRFTYGVPTIGRHSRNFAAIWPRDIHTSMALWGSGTSPEIRILGDARSYLRKYKQPKFPADWVVYRENDIRPEAFMSSIDFFIYFPDEQYAQTFCREALEAAASGAVVVLPERFKVLHGDTAIYASPEEVSQIVGYYSAHASERALMVNRGRESLVTTPFEDNFLEHLCMLQNVYGTLGTRTSERDA